MDISARSQKFIGSVASMLRGRMFGAEDVCIHVTKTKCIPFIVLIIYDYMLMLWKD